MSAFENAPVVSPPNPEVGSGDGNPGVDRVRRTTSALFSAAVFCLALFGTAQVIGRFLRPLNLFEISPRLTYLEENSGKYDLLFIGSSRVRQQFASPEFDKALAQAGISTKSFNFGVNGMVPLESFCVLRRILANGHRFKWVVVELSSLWTEVDTANASTARFLHWHEFEPTWLTVRQAAIDEKPLPTRLTRMGLHIGGFFENTLLSGRSSEVLAGKFRKAPKTYAEPTPWKENGGFVPMSGTQLTGERLARYERAIQRLKEGRPTVPLPPPLRDAVRQLADEIRATGARPLFVVMPTVKPEDNFGDLRSQGIDAPLISFGDVARFLELYRADRRVDETHLDEIAAVDLTREIARQFIPIADESTSRGAERAP